MSRRGLKIGGRLDRYVGELFLSSYATAFLIVIGLFLILDMASNLDEYLETWPDGRRASNLDIASYYLLEIPFMFLQVAPFVTLAAGLFTVSKLIKLNETVAALAAGVSSSRLLAPVFVGGVACTLGAFLLRELSSSAVASRRDALRTMLEHKQDDLVYPVLWLRDLNGSAVLLEEFRPGPPPLAIGVWAMLRGDSEWSSTEARSAVHVPRGSGMGWRLENGVHEVVAGSQRKEAAEWLEGFDFTPDLAATYWRARENPLELSFREVLELARRDPDNVTYQTLLHYHMTFPLANIVLLLVGLPIPLRRDRRRPGEALAAGAILCVFYFATDFVLRNLGLQGSLDPLLAAWLPVLIFGTLGLVLYDSVR